MRPLLTLLLLACVAAPAQAHFIWLVPDKDNKSFALVFSDKLAPDEDVPIAKIAATKLLGRDADDKALDVRMVEAKHQYDVAIGGERPALVAGVCSYGVLTKKGDPFLLMYYPKGILLSGTRADESKPCAMYEGLKELPLDVIAGPKEKEDYVRVLFRGKPLAAAEVTLLMAGHEDAPAKGKTGDDGYWQISAGIKDAGLKPGPGAVIGILVKHTEKKAGELDGKKYAEVRHYTTLTFRVPPDRGGKAKEKESEVSFGGDKKADPAATKVLEDARAARALWESFPGFHAPITINRDGRIIPGLVTVTPTGKVDVSTDVAGLTDADEALLKQVRAEISSLVGHRLPGGAAETPCVFGDSAKDHPLGRKIDVLGDDMHSSYRIKDRQILEVNRAAGEGRFTITVLKNQLTKEKKYLPSFYVVNAWGKGGDLRSSAATRNTWVRVGAFDLPDTVTTTSSSSTGQSVRTLTFGKHKLGAP